MRSWCLGVWVGTACYLLAALAACVAGAVGAVGVQARSFYTDGREEDNVIKTFFGTDEILARNRVATVQIRSHFLERDRSKTLLVAEHTMKSHALETNSLHL